MLNGAGYFGDEDDVDAGAGTPAGADQPAAAAPESQPPAGAPPATPAAAPTPGPAAVAAAADVAFDLDGRPYKVGQALTKEDIEVFGRAVLRNKDYTTKTAQVARMRQEMEGTYQRMLRDPNFFLQYFPREWLQGVLGAGQPGAAAPAAGQPDMDLSNFEPEAQQVIKGLLNQVKGLEGKLGEYDKRFQTFDQRFASMDQMQTQGQMESELSEALKVYPQFNNPLDRRYLWMGIAADGDKTFMQAAAELDELKRANGGVTPSPAGRPVPKAAPRVVPPGGTVPIGQKAPKTFEEADQALHARLGVPYRA